MLIDEKGIWTSTGDSLSRTVEAWLDENLAGVPLEDLTEAVQIVNETVFTYRCHRVLDAQPSPDPPPDAIHPKVIPFSPRKLDTKLAGRPI